MTRALTFILSAALATACAARGGDARSPAPVSAQPTQRVSTEATAQTSMNRETQGITPVPTEEPVSPLPEPPVANPMPHQVPPAMPDDPGTVDRVPQAPTPGTPGTDPVEDTQRPRVPVDGDYDGVPPDPVRG